MCGISKSDFVGFEGAMQKIDRIPASMWQSSSEDVFLLPEKAIQYQSSRTKYVLAQNYSIFSTDNFVTGVLPCTSNFCYLGA